MRAALGCTAPRGRGGSPRRARRARLPSPGRASCESRSSSGSPSGSRRSSRLSDEQAAKLKAIATEHGGRRRELRHRERDLRAALDGQIQDGTTSDQDSVARLTRELLDLRVEYAESWREEMGKLSPFLTPVQRARLLVMRERLIQRVHEMRGDRRGFRHGGDGH